MMFHYRMRKKNSVDAIKLESMPCSDMSEEVRLDVDEKHVVPVFTSNPPNFKIYNKSKIRNNDFRVRKQNRYLFDSLAINF